MDTIEKEFFYVSLQETVKDFFLTRYASHFLYTLQDRYYEQSIEDTLFDNRVNQLNDINNDLWGFHFSEEESGYLKYPFMLLNEIVDFADQDKPVPLEYIASIVREQEFFQVLLQESLISIEGDFLMLQDEFKNMLKSVKQECLEPLK